MTDFPSRIPLFPQPLVLFPGQYKSLRVFEPRYHRLLHDCLNEPLPFGIIFTDTSRGDSSELPTHRIGVMVQIQRVEPLDDGSIGMEVAAVERFRVHDYYNSKPYLIAEISPFPLQYSDASRTAQLQKEVEIKLDHYLQMLTEASGIQFNVYAIPEEAEDLAYLTAMVLQINNQQKQSLLNQATLPDLLQQESQFLSSELNLMSWINQTIAYDRRRGYGIDRWLHLN